MLPSGSAGPANLDQPAVAAWMGNWELGDGDERKELCGCGHLTFRFETLPSNPRAAHHCGEMWK